MKKFSDLKELAFEISYEIENAAKKAGFRVSDTGTSAQSCSTYVTITRESDDGETEQSLSIRISDHTARSCISPVDYYIAIGATDWTANDTLKISDCWCDFNGDECDEYDDDAEHDGYAVSDYDFAAIVANAIAAAQSAEWE